jgi:hypothetical protein
MEVSLKINRKTSIDHAGYMACVKSRIDITPRKNNPPSLLEPESSCDFFPDRAHARPLLRVIIKVK